MSDEQFQSHFRAGIRLSFQCQLRPKSDPECAAGNAPGMRPEWAQNAPGMRPECAQNAPGMCPECTLNAP